MQDMNYFYPGYAPMRQYPYVYNGRGFNNFNDAFRNAFPDAGSMLRDNSFNNISNIASSVASPTAIMSDTAMDAGINAAANKVAGVGKNASTATNPARRGSVLLKGAKGRTFSGAAKPVDAFKQPNKLQAFWSKSIKPNFGWSKGKGLKMFGKNIGKYANIGSGIIQGAEALGNLENLGKISDGTDDLIAQIITSASSNPIANSYLTADQKALLGKVKRGGLDTDLSMSSFMPDSITDLASIAPDALLGLLTGGIPGALIGGIGGAVNSGLEGSAQEQMQQQAELEALLMALQDAEMQYQSMKRPNFTGLGIQQRYQDMYM